MKIWRNDKRVIRSSHYMYCEDCVLHGAAFKCLAYLYKIHDPRKVCLKGYKYETNV